ncbi:SCO7613 C-terminal domain-containing membrane protein [Mycetocola lacteus]|uniref:SCO7613 C-terminal domain-containing membrane protein n=1 Tax=Mycetocola lacteus TaxID=76637 RepID=UPI0015FEC2AE|nr:hypothetical protein [Mycetocola lacteus]
MIRLRSQALDAALLERAGLIAAMRSRQSLPAGTADTLAWPPTALALMDPSRCPGCFAELSGVRCASCGLALNHDGAVELAQVSRAAGDLAEERRRAILALPIAAPYAAPAAPPITPEPAAEVSEVLTGDESPVPEPEWVAPVAAMSAQDIPVAPQSQPAAPAPRVTPVPPVPPVATVSPATPVAPAPVAAPASPATPAPVAAPALPIPPAPPGRPADTQVDDERAPRRSSIQTTLLTLGVVLLVAAALFFATLAYLGTTPPVRAVILLGVAAATAAVSGFLVKRLPSTAHALAILSTILALIDAGLVRAFDVAGISGLDPIFSAGLGLGIVGALAVLAERLTHVRSYAFIAALLLPLAAFGLAGSIGATASQTVWLGALAAFVIAVAGSRFLRSRARRAPERILLESLGLGFVIVATGSVPGVAQGGDILLVFLLGATALAWLGFAILTTSPALRIVGRTGAALLGALTPLGLLGTTIAGAAQAFSPPTLPALCTVVLSTAVTAAGIWLLTRHGKEPSLATLLPGWTGWIVSAVVTLNALGWYVSERAAESASPHTADFLSVALPGLAILLVALVPLGYAAHRLRALRDVLPWLLAATTLAATVSVFTLESRFAQSALILVIVLLLAETSIRLPRRLPGVTFWLVPAALAGASILLALVRSPSEPIANIGILALTLAVVALWRIRAEQDPQDATPIHQRWILSLGAFVLGLALVWRIVLAQAPATLTIVAGWEMVYATAIAILLSVIPPLSRRFRVSSAGASEARLAGVGAAFLLIVAGMFYAAGLIIEPRPDLLRALLPVVGIFGALLPVLRPARIHTGIRQLLIGATILLTALAVAALSLYAGVQVTIPLAILVLLLSAAGNTPLRERLLGGPTATVRRLAHPLTSGSTRLSEIPWVRVITDVSLLVIALPVFLAGLNLPDAWAALPILAVAAGISAGAHGNPLLQTSGPRRFQLVLALGIASCALWVALGRAQIETASAYAVPSAALFALLILLTIAHNPIHPKPSGAALGLGVVAGGAALSVAVDGIRFGDVNALIIGLVALLLAGAARFLPTEWRNLPVRMLTLWPTAGTLLVVASIRALFLTGPGRSAFPSPEELWTCMLVALVLIFLPRMRRESFGIVDSAIGLIGFAALLVVSVMSVVGTDHQRATLLLLAVLFALIAVAGYALSRWGGAFWITALTISGVYGILAGLLAHAAPELGVAPAIVAALGIGVLVLRRTPGRRSMPVLGLPLALGTVISLIAGWVDPHPTRLVGLGVVCIALVLWGVLGKLQAPFVIGTIVLLAHVIVQAFPLIRAITDTLSWAVWAGLGGVLLLVVGATYEARLRQAKNLVHAISALR